MSIPVPPPAPKPWYKRVWVWIVAAVVAVLLAVGFVSAMVSVAANVLRPDPAPTVTVTPEPEQETEAAPEPEQEEEPAPAPVPDATADESVYLDYLHKEQYFTTVDDASLVKVGYATCEAIASGVSLDELLYISMENNVPAYEAGYMIAAAVGTLCPEYTYVIEDYLAQNGS